MSALDRVRNLARRRIPAPQMQYNPALQVTVSYWEYNMKHTGGFQDDQETPLRAQVIAWTERHNDITLSPRVRVYLGDDTPFELTVLSADTTLDDILARPGSGIHPVGAHGWMPLDGQMTVHVFDYAPDHNCLYMQRFRNAYW